MAIQHISTILCNYLIRADSGLFTFAGVFKNIKAPQLPISKFPIGIAVEFTGEVGDIYKISVEGNGVDLTIAEGVIEDIPIPNVHSQSTITIAGEIGLHFVEEGTFEIILRNGEQVVHATKYGVAVIPEEGNDVG